jgi:hypothetical protein
MPSCERRSAVTGIDHPKMHRHLSLIEPVDGLTRNLTRQQQSLTAPSRVYTRFATTRSMLFSNGGYRVPGGKCSLKGPSGRRDITSIEYRKARGSFTMFAKALARVEKFCASPALLCDVRQRVLITRRACSRQDLPPRQESTPPVPSQSLQSANWRACNALTIRFERTKSNLSSAKASLISLHPRQRQRRPQLPVEVVDASLGPACHHRMVTLAQNQYASGSQP